MKIPGSLPVSSSRVKFRNQELDLGSHSKLMHEEALRNARGMTVPCNLQTVYTRLHRSPYGCTYQDICTGFITKFRD